MKKPKKPRPFNKLTYRNKVLKLKLSYEELLETLVREAELREQYATKYHQLVDLKAEDLVARTRAIIMRELKLPYLQLVKE